MPKNSKLGKNKLMNNHQLAVKWRSVMSELNVGSDTPRYGFADKIDAYDGGVISEIHSEGGSFPEFIDGEATALIETILREKNPISIARRIKRSRFLLGELTDSEQSTYFWDTEGSSSMRRNGHSYTLANDINLKISHRLHRRY